MDRREFIKKATLAGAASIGAVKTLSDITAQAAEEKRSAEIIVAHDNEPGKLLEAALKAYGGLGKLIKPGSTVAIKANFSWWGNPEKACDTNPELIGALVRSCRKAGAKKVKVIDYSIVSASLALSDCGIKEATEAAGGEIVRLEGRPATKKSTGVLNKIIGGFHIYNEVLEADCLINVPILKHHRVTQMTGAVKHLMGLTPDRADMHSVGINQAIVDLAKLIKPDLHIIDAYRVLKTNGPQGPGQVVVLKQLILSHDPVAADTYCASLLGFNVPHVKMAGEAGLGCADLSKIKIHKIKA